MKKFGKLMLFALFMMIGQRAVFAQNTVTGTITDKKGEALIGASVAVKGSPGTGTITDIDGRFSINVDNSGTLIFSYTGFEPVEMAVAGQRDISVILSELATVLNQVVVVGYGTLTKKQVTGAIAQVKGDDLKKQPLLTPIQGVQGLAAGIQVIGSGEPGKQPRVQIRGINTILTNENPLYVVDGVITDNITNINGTDVFSIDILKDGAAAIYGTRAANGVILITTRKGREGKMKVSLDSYRGFRKLINVVEMAPSSLYARYTNEARAFDNQAPLFDVDKLKNNTDWFDAISQNGLVQSHNLSLSGGSKEVNYFFSAGYFSDEGVLKGAEFDRITLRANNEYRPFSFLKLGNVLNANISKSDNKSAGAFTDAYRMPPTAAVYDSLTKYGFVQAVSVGNPVANLELANSFSKGNRFQGSFFGELNLLKDLTFRTSWGFDKSTGNDINFTPKFQYGIYGSDKTQLVKSEGNGFYWVWDQTLKYAKNIGDVHNIELLAGHSSESDRGRFYSIRATDVPSDRNLWYVLQTTDPNSVSVLSDGGSLLRRESFFGRLNYGLMDKYNLSGTIRRDGSSAFPKENQWGNFYSVGASWIASEENFMRGNSIFNQLKFRANYALLGNDNISRIVNNDLSQLLSISNTDPYGFQNGLVSGITINQLKDATATWETTKSIDLGTEFAMMNNHISGEVSYYNKLTNAYIRVPTPPVVDPDGILSKAADVRNKGIELSLKWSDYDRENFGYRIGFNATFNKNVVEKVRGGGFVNEGGLGNGATTTQTIEGQPIGSFWVYQTDGIYQDSLSIVESPHFTGTQIGDFRYKDVNNDGALDDRDRVYAGAYQPKVFYGINLGCNWKELDFAIDMYGNRGNKVYNGKKGVRFGNENIEASRADRWRDYATDTDEPRASNTIPKPSTYFVESGDFLRINNITLGYTIKNSSFKQAGISTARVFVTTQNPAIWKKFSGFTPELPGSNALNSGIELFVYPSVATYMVGFNLNFN
jgi:TonB-dependent starch-binding outer membrane protein SusC